MSDSDAVILFHAEGAVAHLVLNRPAKVNAMNGELYNQLERAVIEYAKSPELRCLIISGAGENFSSGGDLAWLREVREQRSADSSGNRTGQMSAGYEFAAYKTMAALDKPIIAAIDGYCIGSGFNLAVLYCDIRVATDRARLGVPGPHRGFGGGGSYPKPFHHYTGVGNVMYMALTGKHMSAEQALRQGFVNEVVSPEELLPRAKALAEHIAEANPDLVRATKRFWQRYPDLPGSSYMIISDLVRREIELYPTAAHPFEGRDAFLEKRKPNWDPKP